MNSEEHSYVFRTIILGSAKSGKSTFCKSYAEGYSCIQREATIGVDFVAKKHQLEDGTIIKVNLWDTAGQEAFRAIIQSYYRDISGALLFFDLTDRSSFDSVERWLKDLRHFNSCNHNHPIILVGNKSDIQDTREISHEEALEYAKKNDLFYVESSCYDIDNIEIIMHHFYTSIYENYKSIPSLQCKGIKLGNCPNINVFSPLRDSELSKKKYRTCC